MEGQEDTQISCRFVTKLPTQYRIPTTEIAVPAKLTRYGLSQVVNHVLALEENVPFDFLVNGELVRSALGTLLLSQNVSAESVLEVEYIFAIRPPELQHEIPHDDWVGALDGGNTEWIASACYDGLLRLWNGKGQSIASSPIHEGPVSSLVQFRDLNKQLLLSGGKLDHVIRLSEISKAGGGHPNARAIAVYKGHGGSVLDIALAPQQNRVASASQDACIKIWPAGLAAVEAAMEDRDDESTEPASSKKLRFQNGAAIPSSTAQIPEDFQLKGHNDACTSVIWHGQETIFSGSMDHSIRKWDTETRINVSTHNDRKAVNTLASPSGGNSNLIAFGGAAKTWQLWDTRAAGTSSGGLKSFTSHASHIHKLAWHPASEHHVVTASMDKTAKLWDMRSAIPLHTLDGHIEQVLCVAWWQDNQVVTGSADNTVRIYQTAL